jgi:biopolymer transport protein ExbD
MAAQIGSDGDDLDELHEINVTPFIDVMLVLLIIFMVAAPLATVDVPVDLPRSTASAAPRPEKPVYLTLKADLALVLNDAKVAREALQPALVEATAGDREERIFLRADQTVDYAALMDLMNLLRAAGYLKVGLVGIETAPDPALSDPGGAAGTPTP